MSAVGLFAYGFRIERLSNPFGAAFDLGYWALPVTVLWFVGMSNAFNLMDGMDGLAAGLATVATARRLAGVRCAAPEAASDRGKAAAPAPLGVGFDASITPAAFEAPPVRGRPQG